MEIHERPGRPGYVRQFELDIAHGPGRNIFIDSFLKELVSALPVPAGLLGGIRTRRRLMMISPDAFQDVRNISVLYLRDQAPGITVRDVESAFRVWLISPLHLQLNALNLVFESQSVITPVRKSLEPCDLKIHMQKLELGDG
jgi:hypothetical protein